MVENLSQPFSSEMDFRTNSPVLTALAVVLNMIWWMVMIAAIAVGSSHMDQCPLEPNIPVYLTVLGACSICSMLASYLCHTLQGGSVHRLTVIISVLLHIFSFTWLITGSFWVYSVYPPDSSGSDGSCHRVTYMLAFTVTTLLWAAVALCCVCVCCCGLVLVCLRGFSTSYDRFTYETLDGSNEPAHNRT